MLIAKLSIHFNSKGVPFKSSFTPLLPVSHRPGHVFMPDGIVATQALVNTAHQAVLNWFDLIPGVSDYKYRITRIHNLVEKKLNMEFHVEDAV